MKLGLRKGDAMLPTGPGPARGETNARSVQRLQPSTAQRYPAVFRTRSDHMTRWVKKTAPPPAAHEIITKTANRRSTATASQRVAAFVWQTRRADRSQLATTRARAAVSPAGTKTSTSSGLGCVCRISGRVGREGDRPEPEGRIHRRPTRRSRLRTPSSRAWCQMTTRLALLQIDRPTSPIECCARWRGRRSIIAVRNSPR
jgi:hypothetical protein